MNSIYYLLHLIIKDNEQDLLDAALPFIFSTYLYSTTLRTRNFISTTGLQEPSLASGQFLHLHGTDSDYLSAMGVNRDTFNYLFHHFAHFYLVLTGPGQPGRPPKLSSKSTVLACLLHYYAGTMETKTLCELFGVPPTTLTRILQNAEGALEKTLRDIPEGKISWPDFREQQKWASWVEKKEPLLKGRWGFLDGKNFRVQKPTNTDLQNAMYNGKQVMFDFSIHLLIFLFIIGWLHNTLITGVFCYGADGTLV